MASRWPPARGCAGRLTHVAPAGLRPASQVRGTNIFAYSRSQTCGAFRHLARWLVARGGACAMTSEVDRGAEGGPRIRTPDQRVRVFVSSTLRELAAERAAART